MRHAVSSDRACSTPRRLTGRTLFHSRGKLDGFTSVSPVFLSKLKRCFNLVLRRDGSVSAPPIFLPKSKRAFRFGNLFETKQKKAAPERGLLFPGTP